MAIDLTDRYNVRVYMREFNRRGERINWTVDRGQEPVVALIIHHTAGFYLGATLDENSTEAKELAQIDAVARDHRERFGIGPGYHYFAFPSNRLYAVGKYGTHRAHTKGINPETGNWWNREALAICAFGDLQANPVAPGLRAAVLRGIEEVRGYTEADLTLWGHREVPGNPTRTTCPGDNLMVIVERVRNPMSPVDEARQTLQEVHRLAGEAHRLSGEALELLG